SILYLEINLLSVAIIAVIRLKTLGLSKMVAQRNFSMALDSMVVFFLSDTYRVIAHNRFLPYWKTGVILSKDIYFLSTALMCYFWFVYFEYLQDSPFVKNRKRLWISSAFVWIQLILIIVNHFVPILYYVDESRTYTRGPLFFLLYIFAYIYVLVTCTRAFIGLLDKRKAEQRQKLLMLAIFPIAPAIGGIIQYIVPNIPVVCGMLSIATLVLYLNWITEMVSVDPLTKLNNRKQLVHHYEQWVKGNDEHMDIQFLMIDANRFNSINDTYGHVEGDAALARVAEALRRGCKVLKHRANIARYGGDEFVIITKGETDESIEELKKAINDSLQVLIEEANSPYPLTVSIGTAMAGGYEKLSFKVIAELADEELYEEKKKLPDNGG
ncbi:MAG: diguanylate cyclase, partial [Lachnospiraceae bacterium]|nr:diguanylate cyclase [Lachnospiraceae bacterium]